MSLSTLRVVNYDGNATTLQIRGCAAVALRPLRCTRAPPDSPDR